MLFEQVIELIKEEREYQDLRWGSGISSCDDNHSTLEWLVFIEDYVNEAKHILSRNCDDQSTELSKHIMRKIAALAVAAMENNGSLPRVPGK